MERCAGSGIGSVHPSRCVSGAGGRVVSVRRVGLSGTTWYPPGRVDPDKPSGWTGRAR